MPFDALRFCAFRSALVVAVAVALLTGCGLVIERQAQVHRVKLYQVGANEYEIPIVSLGSAQHVTLVEASKVMIKGMCGGETVDDPAPMLAAQKAALAAQDPSFKTINPDGASLRGRCADGDGVLPRVLTRVELAPAGAAVMTLINTSGALQAGHDVIYISVDGQELAMLAKLRELSIAMTPGTHDITLKHIDTRPWVNIHSVDVPEGESFYKAWVTIDSTEIERLDALPPNQQPYVNIL